MDTPTLLSLNTPIQQIQVTKPIKVGRDPSCHIIIPNQTCSKVHFTISPTQVFDKNVYILQDSSTHGTFVNGVAMETSVLSPDSEIEIKHQIFFIFMPSPTRFIQDYCLLNNNLGKGSFALVNLAINRKSGKRVACKIFDIKSLQIKKKQTKDQVLDLVQGEIKLLERVRHPNICKIHDSFITQHKVYIFLQLVIGGDLFDYVVRNQGIDEHESKFIFYQICKALTYLHKLNICHRDLKPENILLSSQKPFSQVYITDFGMSRIFDDQMQTKCGTVQYFAPEIFTGSYTVAVDCWCLGCILFIMIACQVPFENQCFKLEFPKRFPCSQDGRNLIRGLLQVDPCQRLNIGQVMEHTWIKSQQNILEKLYQKECYANNRCSKRPN